MSTQHRNWIGHRQTFVVVSLAALAFHIAGIYTLHDLRMDLGSYHGGALGALLQNPDAQTPVERMDRDQWEEELAAVLNQVVAEPARDEEVDKELEMLNAEISSEGLFAEAEDELAFSIPSELPDELFAELNEASMSQKSSEEFSPDVPSARSLFEADTKVADDILGATNVVPGMQDRSLPTSVESSNTGSSSSRAPSPSSLGAIANTEAFRLEVSAAKAEMGDGYVFELRFVPKEDAQLRRVKQNMFFVLDRSYSIPKRRYEASKFAVLDSLEYLQEGDTFNILVFDKKVERLAEQPLPLTADSKRLAEEFLRSQKHGGIFASTDLYQSLDKIVPKAVSDYEVNTAILMSDGDTHLSQEDQRASIGSWTDKNQGKVSLFTIAAGSGNHLPLLQLLSRYNKGRLAYSEAEAGLAQALSGLVKSLRRPVGKDLRASVVATAPTTRIELFPAARRMPDLYDGTPFTLYGRVNDREPFHLFVQGKFYGRWFDIKRTISFDHLQEVDRRIEREVAIAEAYEQYDRFLDEGSRSAVAEAKQILAPFRVPAAFR